MKISVLMPSYNDGLSIVETLNSLKFQTFKNWELLIMDDGSKDTTREVVMEYMGANKELDIQYHYQSNQDQLAALENLVDMITGDIVFILHSDDLFYSNHTMELYVNYIFENNEFDAYYGDLIIIDNESKKTGDKISPGQFYRSHKNLAMTYLWLGRNSYVDYAYFKVEIFSGIVRENYLKRNVPYWFSNKPENLLNIKKTNIPMALYRVHSDNYINNSLGQNVVLSGSLRVATSLMSQYYIPFYQLQFILFRIVNKINLERFFTPLYFKNEEKNKYENINFIIKKSLGVKSTKNIYFSSIALFFKKTGQVRIIKFDFDGFSPEDYLGRNAKAFFKKVDNNTLDESVLKLLDEIKQGFTGVIVSEENLDISKIVLDFFCIRDYVEIIEERQE